MKILGPAAWTIPKRTRKIFPPKVVMFLWKAMENKIAAKENLMDKGIVVENEGRCSICAMEIESTRHLLMICNLSWMCWSMILARESLQWCIPRSLQEVLFEWKALKTKSDQILWELILHSLCWSIWLARIKVAFQNGKFS